VKGLSLGALTELTGMDGSALSKLESGQRANPTVETLVRYAEAAGKRLVVSLADVRKV
jgi:transcriptional regulator with XRE-family HTH domain